MERPLVLKDTNGMDITVSAFGIGNEQILTIGAHEFKLAEALRLAEYTILAGDLGAKGVCLRRKHQENIAQLQECEGRGAGAMRFRPSHLRLAGGTAAASV
jgi:hypothetical protein